MKKILIMVPSLYVGGMERMLVNIANVLANLKYDVTVLNLTSDDQAIVENLNHNVHYKKKVVPVKFFLHATKEDWLKRNIRFLPFKYWMKMHSSKYLHKKYIHDFYDIEIAFYTGYSVKIINGCPSKTKKIFWLHGEAWLMDGMVQGYWRKAKAEKVYKNFDQIVCVSERIRQDFYKRFGTDCNVKTISNINDVNKIKKMANESCVKKKEFTFVLVGRVDNKNKGFDRCLTATKMLNDKGYRFSVWIVGDGIDFLKLKEQKEQLMLDNVTLWGMQENPYKFIKNADVFICTSHYEGYGLVVAEALILEKPVLSTNVSGPAEILNNGDYGMLVENSTEGIYKGMKAFLDNPVLISDYKERALTRAEFFDSNHIINQIKEIL